MPVNRQLFNKNAKRARTSRRQYPRYSSAIKQYTRPIGRTWPYQRLGWSKSFDPFPNKLIATLRYSTTISLVPSSGIVASYLFRSNSIFDPDYTSVGHQPYGYDQYAAIYNHYIVRRSTITMQPTSQPQTQVYGVSLTDDATVQGDFDTIRETKGTRLAICGPEIGAANKVTQVFSTNESHDAQFQGNLQSTFPTNPGDTNFFHCWASAQNSTAGSGTNNYLITISYEVEMWELKDLGQS